MNRKNVCGLCVCWFLCWAAVSVGWADERKEATSPQPSPPAEREMSSTNGVTVEGIVSESLERNPELNFYRAEIAAAKAGRKAAGLWSNPELSGSVGRKTSRELSSGATAEGVAWSVSVAQPFEWPGRIGLRKAI